MDNLKKIIYTIFFIFLTVSLTGQTQTYYLFTASGGLLAPLVIPPGRLSDALHWKHTNIEQIPIYLFFDSSILPVDPGFIESDFNTEFEQALEKWQNQTDFGFSETTNIDDGCTMTFSSDPTIFNSNRADVGGMTPLASDNLEIVVTAIPSQTQFIATNLILNNTTNRAFQWTTSFVYMPDPQHINYLNCYNVLLHEFGHLIGLSHNADFRCIMYYQMVYNQIGQKDLYTLDITNADYLASDDPGLFYIKQFKNIIRNKSMERNK